MWNDIETTQDFLNFSVIADTVAELIIEANGQPISIGVSGNWGAGKSSMVKMIGESLKKKDEAKEDSEKDYVFLEFNAWLYQGYDDARTALLQAVTDKLLEESKKREPAKNFTEKVKEFSERVNWLQIAKLLIPLSIGLLPGGVAVGGIASLFRAVTGVLSNTDKEKSGDNSEELNKALESISPEIKEMLKDSVSKSIPQQIEKLRMDFEKLLSEMNITLVVLVDDLDRCLPSTAISTLEAMRLLLFVKRTAFIIAADEQMIRSSVKAHFSNIEMSDGLVTSYFDKLIQIPLTVPHLGVAEIKIYLVLLFAELAVRRGKISEEAFDKAKCELVTLLRNAWQGGIPISKIQSVFDETSRANIRGEIDIAEQLSGILVSADNIKGNPRLVKRFLNALIIREKVAKLNGFTLDVGSLIKMLLFERCASSGAYEYLVKQTDKSEDGKLEFLQKLEGELANGNEYCPPEPTWKSPFIESWLKLSPALGEGDIRPLLYLSRDRSLVLAAYDELSPEARELLDALNQIDNGTTMTVLVEKLRVIGETESEMLLNRIIRMGRTNQWEVNTLYEALHVTEAFPALGEKLVSGLSEIPAKSLKPAYIPVLKEKPWAIELLKQWSENVDTPANVSKLIKGTNERKR